ncbi:MAG: FAD-binding protein [Opitutaceae bacterium]|nr:FAD-binding protein [Opitutaceae bacterium]
MPPAERLREVMPTGMILTSPAQLASYESDALGFKRFRPDAVVIPGCAAELIGVVRLLKDQAVPFTLRGAGTSLSGGPVAAQGGVVVHTSRLRRIEKISPTEMYALVECGVVLQQLDQALQPHGLYYPPDPSSAPSATLGGNVATNAGGAHCLRYGVTSNYVLGVEAVLLDGSVVTFGGPAGGRGPYRDDWKRLMVGSEGTLAAFTRLWLRLIPQPAKVWTFRATFLGIEAVSAAITHLATHVSCPAAIELMDPRSVAMVENSPMAVGLPAERFMLLAEIDGPAPLVDHRVDAVAAILRECGSDDVAFSDEPDIRAALWKARKAQGGLLGQISPDFLVQDAVIPKSQLAEILQFIYDEADRSGIPVATVIHAGDGNLHPNFLFDSRRPADVAAVEGLSKRLMRRVMEVGGTLSGEHGIGNDKAMYMEEFVGPAGVAMQMAIPRAFNPRHQLNPEKIFPERHFASP